jgi:SAM-dependent methyltransferase
MSIHTSNSSRYHLLLENKAFASQIPAGSMVLDVGAGQAPYRNLFAHTQYETADFEMVDKVYAPSTYVCDLKEIPVEDARFDYIIFNQVMEHLPEPKAVLIEIHRVLKPNGKMIFSAPLFYEEHEQPYDFYRYTQFGVKYLMESVGFTVVRLDWLEGYFSTIGYQLDRMARYLPYNSYQLVPGVISYILVPIMLILKDSFWLALFFSKKWKRRLSSKIEYIPRILLPLFPNQYIQVNSSKTAEF